MAIPGAPSTALPCVSLVFLIIRHTSGQNSVHRRRRRSADDQRSGGLAVPLVLRTTGTTAPSPAADAQRVINACARFTRLQSAHALNSPASQKRRTRPQQTRRKLERRAFGLLKRPLKHNLFVIFFFLGGINVAGKEVKRKRKSSATGNVKKKMSCLQYGSAPCLCLPN